MKKYPIFSRIDVINELERISYEAGQITGVEKRTFAKALLILLREV